VPVEFVSLDLGPARVDGLSPLLAAYPRAPTQSQTGAPAGRLEELRRWKAAQHQQLDGTFLVAWLVAALVCMAVAAIVGGMVEAAGYFRGRAIRGGMALTFGSVLGVGLRELGVGEFWVVAAAMGGISAFYALLKMIKPPPESAPSVGVPPTVASVATGDPPADAKLAALRAEVAQVRAAIEHEQSQRAAEAEAARLRLELDAARAELRRLRGGTDRAGDGWDAL